FETFILKSFSDYSPVDERFESLFNSYYNSVGQPFPRHRRGLLSRPTVGQTITYRRRVDEAIERVSERISADENLLSVMETGLNHEQQHQELMWTDIKHVLSCNPMDVSMFLTPPPASHAIEHDFVMLPQSIQQIGHCGDGFCFDNETPRHRVLLPEVSMGNRLITNGEYLEFVTEGGYARPEFWLSLGWSWVQDSGAVAPLYWQNRHGTWMNYTLSGIQPIDLDAPVSHLTYVEADAYARYRSITDKQAIRLPTEFEWETFALDREVHDPVDPFDCGHGPHPVFSNPDSQSDVAGLYGSVWQWTSSSYSPYPGYRPPDGALGEYNGKFMCNQYVLRGSSCATSAGHARLTYRNFFPYDAQWQYTGLRLARDESRR
ncbi:MAG: ergothioneine biosynthesis protein EgtB, partial [Planctomycetota bacterium]